jgi:outer membrane protein TolC
MNYPVNQDIELTQSLSDIMLEWNTTTEMENVSIRYADRQEYKLLELGEQLNNLDYKRTQAAFYPTLRGFANAQGNLYRKDLFNNDETGWIPQSAVGLALNVPIYDGGEKSAKLQRIKIRNMETAIEKQNLENAIQLQVANAYIAYTNAGKTLETRKKALDKTNAMYNKTLIKFREGVGSSLEVTQSEADLFRAQAAYTDAGYALLSAMLDWKAALGKL